MTDLTPVLNELLKSYNAPPTADPALTLQNIDAFLKEAYRINSHIATLNAYLRDIRQSYLSTAPQRRTTLSSQGKQWRNLSERDREEIDANTKKLLRELNESIRKLDEMEGMRHNAETIVLQKKYASPFGRLGSWAAGGAAQSKSTEHELGEAKLNAIKMHRDSVIWYLRQKLEECGSLQASMMEKRIMRVMEKNKSSLAKSRALTELKGFDNTSKATQFQSIKNAHLEPQEQTSFPDQDLSPEQIQMFEKENQDMVKHYQSTLDQVKTAEKSLIEISELQTQLVNNLATQSAHIEQLVNDSFQTTENVGGGNKELKKATQRKSTAKYVFYASCGLSVFLVVWDLVI